MIVEVVADAQAGRATRQQGLGTRLLTEIAMKHPSSLILFTGHGRDNTLWHRISTVPLHTMFSTSALEADHVRKELKQAYLLRTLGEGLSTSNSSTANKRLYKGTWATSITGLQQ